MVFTSTRIAPIGITVLRLMVGGLPAVQKTSNKTLARQIYEAKKVDCLRNGASLEIRQRITFPTIRERFLEGSKLHKRSYGRDVILVNHLTKFFGNRLLEDITPLEVEQ